MIDEISNEQLLQQMQEIRSSINTESVQKASEPGQLDQEFGQVLDKLITDVDQAQKEADMSIQQLATGETTSIQDVVMKIEQADVSFQLMKEIRNKLLEAYKEIMTMQT
ncbi:MAG: flagellar hook-basal body complex protein FliE [Victivallales bacterium]|jgi:flagellar hook-basal body complex protein FliE|nr:flagellar hook-basal body complex protein FliE [Victivallales bacterium]|eukprot:TRINITY_DN15916_c0_g1_i5.p1 TRINITY_DN15916_c0_g1~~TRINITY_DN15916_c0_g1_i5.p1  ORF type:complete len:109 (-),score=33.20 TRINITY_DN15916_c0_g1_i5:162-488(-)